MRIGIIGPYTQGSEGKNTRAAIDAFVKLADAGHAVFCPHLTHFVALVHPRFYEYWMAQTDGWFRVCEAVLRLPGVSPGGDREEALCLSLGIPVYRDIGELLGAFGAYVGHSEREA